MLSVLIPAYNEQDTIGETIEAIVIEFNKENLEHELLVVNDGSNDETEKYLLNLQKQFPTLSYINNPGPYGYGCAVRFGLDHFKGDAVVIAMADGSDSPDDMIKYYEKIIEGYDCSFGSRFMLGASVENYPRFKLFLNRLGNYLIAKLTGKKYNDFTNGFKCYKREVIDHIQPLISGRFNLTIEMSIRAVQADTNIAIIPIDWRDRSAGKTSFRVLGEAWLYLQTILYCLLAHRLSLAVSRQIEG